MKIAVAQVRPTVGQIEVNVHRHLCLIEMAKNHGADLVVFPELSLSGYEPTRAAEFARPLADVCLANFQTQANDKRIAIGVGFPLQTSGKPEIAMMIGRPKQTPMLYSKQTLHADEVPYFEPGRNVDGILNGRPKIAVAICFELSVPEHAELAFNNGAKVYIASVAKTDSGVKAASDRLSSLAQQHAAITMMANCLGTLDGVECVGQSSVWGRSGELLGQLDAESEGVLVVDFDQESVVCQSVRN